MLQLGAEATIAENMARVPQVTLQATSLLSGNNEHIRPLNTGPIHKGPSTQEKLAVVAPISDGSFAAAPDWDPGHLSPKL